MADLSSDIASQGVEPQATSVDGHSTASRSTGEMIRADVYAGAGKTAAKQRRRGITFSKLISPGPLSDQGQAATVPAFVAFSVLLNVTLAPAA